MTFTQALLPAAILMVWIGTFMAALLTCLTVAVNWRYDDARVQLRRLAVAVACLVIATASFALLLITPGGIS